MRAETPEQRNLRAASFDTIAEQYQASRPTYPTEIFDDIWRLAKLPHSPAILELGCGPGKASVEFARRGGRLTCIEMGSRMADLARKALSPYPTAQVIVSKFKDWNPGEARFDLLTAFAAWHWMDKDTRYAMAAAALKPTGSLAIVSSKHVFPAGFDPRYERIQQVYREVTGSAREWPPEPPEATPDNREEMLESGCFESVQVSRRLWSLNLSADEYVALLGTFSDHLVLDPKQREDLFAGIREAIGTERIEKPYLSILRVASGPSATISRG